MDGSWAGGGMLDGPVECACDLGAAPPLACCAAAAAAAAATFLGALEVGLAVGGAGSAGLLLVSSLGGFSWGWLEFLAGGGFVVPCPGVGPLRLVLQVEIRDVYRLYALSWS